MSTLERRQHQAHAPQFSRPAPHIPPRREAAVRIKDDAEAILIARNLAAQFREGAVERDRERRLPIAEIDQFSQSGLWGITIPKKYGGAGVSNVTLAEVTAIISEADASLGQIPQNHFYMVESLRLSGSEAQKKRYFQRVLDGDRLGNAFVEIGTRTPVEFKTRLTPNGEGYLLSGQKFYSTGSLFAHLILVVALNEQDRTHVVFLERATPGLQIVDDWAGFGQRTTGSGTTTFDAIPVGKDQVIPHQDVFDRPTPMGPLAQIIHAAVETGIARAALKDTLDFTRQYARPWFETKYERGTDDPHLIA